MKYRNVFFLLLAVVLIGCQRKQPIVILYENDVHCAVEGYAHLVGETVNRIAVVCRQQVDEMLAHPLLRSERHPFRTQGIKNFSVSGSG